MFSYLACPSMLGHDEGTKENMATADCKASYNDHMAFHPTITANTAVCLSFVAGGAVAGRKLMGSAGLRQPAAHS
ncbi:hypothetical protein [Rhodoferax sp.]|uniref:hypothetical protein n=1 Tax=Rhodoferax sp. TaxID=50421 RepID=UPI00262E3868|nr:hypothetical protein [Rhodoferax sp.]